MRKSDAIWILILVMLGVSGILFGQQEQEYDDLLQRVDTVENPVYKPVVSVSYGVLNFIGDVRNSHLSPALGNPSVKINLATFVDNEQHFTANFNFQLGRLTGNQYSVTDLEQNLNFLTPHNMAGSSLKMRF